MNTNVNFVLPKDEAFLKEQKRGKIINVIAIAFPILVGVVSLIIFLITQAINPVSIKEQQEKTIGELSRLQDKKIKLLIINDRLDNIDELLKKRKDFTEKINILLSKMPNEVLLQNLQIDNTKLLLIVSSASLGAIDELINNLIDMAAKREIISSLSLDSLTFDENGNNYLVSLKSEL